jgi:hypothetical protein
MPRSTLQLRTVASIRRLRRLDSCHCRRDARCSDGSVFVIVVVLLIAALVPGLNLAGYWLYALTMSRQIEPMAHGAVA